MSDMSQSDAELAYRYLPDRLQGDIQYDAHSQTLDTWRSEQPDDLDTLEAAHDDCDSPFTWEIDLTFERSQANGDDELVPHTYTGDASDEIHELARDFAWDYVDAVRDEVRDLQSATNFSPREFVAYVLSESRVTNAEAAREMDISKGTFDSKLSREVRPEIDSARETVQFVNMFD